MPDDKKPLMIDSHAHLDYPQLSDDLDGVLARANAAGVTHIITIGVKLSTADAPKRLQRHMIMSGVRLAFTRTKLEMSQTRRI